MTALVSVCESFADNFRIEISPNRMNFLSQKLEIQMNLIQS